MMTAKAEAAARMNTKRNVHASQRIDIDTPTMPAVPIPITKTTIIEMTSLRKLKHFEHMTLASTTDDQMPEVVITHETQDAFELLIEATTHEATTRIRSIGLDRIAMLFNVAKNFNENEIAKQCYSKAISHYDELLDMHGALATELGHRLSIATIFQALYIALLFEQTELLRKCDTFIRLNEEEIIAAVAKVGSKCTWLGLNYITGRKIYLVARPN